MGFKPDPLSLSHMRLKRCNLGLFLMGVFTVTALRGDES